MCSPHSLVARLPLEGLVKVKCPLVAWINSWTTVAIITNMYWACSRCSADVFSCNTSLNPCCMSDNLMRQSLLLSLFHREEHWGSGGDIACQRHCGYAIRARSWTQVCLTPKLLFITTAQQLHSWLRVGVCEFGILPDRYVLMVWSGVGERTWCSSLGTH